VENINTRKERTAGTIPGGHRPKRQIGEKEKEKKERNNQSKEGTETSTTSSNVISEKTVI
jgi:hypothetical protein